MPRPKTRDFIVQPSDESFRYIPLTQGQVAMVDASDYEQISKFTWHAFWSKGIKNYYAVRKAGPASKRTTIYMHRQIMNVSGREMHVDHIDPAMTLDNRRANLRTCTPQQNRCNSRMYANNKSGFRGVIAMKDGTFKAQATVNNKVRNLGKFPTPEEAHSRFIAFVSPLRGEFLRVA